MKKVKTYRDRLVDNIDAIGTAHTQMMDILKEGISLTEINEDKWKAVAEGKGKAQEVADKLLAQLKLKEDELYALDNPEEAKNNESQKIEATDDNGKSKLNKHLN